MSRVLILGAGGMLARDLRTEAPDDVEVVSHTSQTVDVTNRHTLGAAIAEVDPDVVINCAAYTDVDGAESQQERAFAVNGDAPGFIAAALAGRPRHDTPSSDALMVHYGTDYVFDGSGSRPYREEDPTAPAGAYGASKLAGELAIAREGRRYVILRTQWLYGLYGRSFPRTMWERARASLPTKVVNDQTGRPTYTVDLARATWRLLSGGRGLDAGVVRPAEGRILHVANGGRATWYDVAQRVFQRAGKSALLTPCSTAEFPRPAKRPAWSVLDTTRFETTVGPPLPLWEDALDRFLDQLEDHPN